MNRYVFSDEAGDFTFRRDGKASRYFIICTVTTRTLVMAEAMTRLRHDLLREGLPVADCFHATTDAQAVRDRVYAEILKHDFTFQVTICEKSKAHPKITASKARFYKTPWFFHFKHALAPHLIEGERLVVTAASVGTRKERAAYAQALEDVVRQCAAHVDGVVDFRPAMADPLLQVADYCAWATQRSWERQDDRSLNLIKERRTYDYDLWKHGTKHHY
jgi:hypothetical protein